MDIICLGNKVLSTSSTTTMFVYLYALRIEFYYETSSVWEYVVWGGKVDTYNEMIL